MARAENRATKVTGKGSGRGTDGLTPNRPHGLPKHAGYNGGAKMGAKHQKSGITGKARGK